MHLSENKSVLNPLILRYVLKAAREDKGISKEELAVVVCLREWQIIEIEEADTFINFYSMAIKVNATKRIGAYLGLKESEYLSLEA